MNRRQWLRMHSTNAYLSAVKADKLVKAVRSSIRSNERSITLIEDMIQTAVREPVLAVPHDLEKLRNQCEIHGIQVTLTGIQVNLVRIDLTDCTDKVRNHIMRFIREIVVQVTIKTDSDFAWGYTARLTPTTQKIKK